MSIRGSRIKVTVDTKRITPKVLKATKGAIYPVSSQVLKDSNFYIPLDTGNMRDSSIRSSDLEKGKIVWDTPYARRMYYGTHFRFSKYKNPRAQALWAEKAKSAHSREWARVAKKAVEKGL